ncbi:MAG: universal stress protein [Deltaproteobacteria bacterium]
MAIDIPGWSVARARVPAVRAAGHLAQGQAFLEIIRHARRRGAELIVLGRHGRRVFRDLVIGSTAQRVVRHSSVPALVVNLEPTGPYRRPLLATDLEPGSRRIAGLAARIIDPKAAVLSVVHAYEVPFEGWLSPGDVRGDWVSDYRRSHQEHAAKEVNRFVASLGAAGLRCRPRVRRGDPRAVVLEEAKRRRADLVILGTHDRSGAVRALLGSVAETVVAEATCDVLVGRPTGLAITLR